MFTIPQANQVVVQCALLGDDEVAIRRVFDELVELTGGTAFDSLGTDAHRVRVLRYETDAELDGLIIAINLASVASPAQKFRHKPITTGTMPALSLAVMGLDIAIVLGEVEPVRSAIGSAIVIALAEPTLGELRAAIDRGLTALRAR